MVYNLKFYVISVRFLVRHDFIFFRILLEVNGYYAMGFEGENIEMLKEQLRV